ncbi:MAG: PBSX family phage terminase large subunit [Anaerotignaceae bacterium]
MLVKLDTLIAPSFYSVHNHIKKNKFTHYFLKGGRGSTKSSFISLEIIFGIMKDSKANCVALRKVGINLKDSVYEQLLWSIKVLGVENYWQAKLSPLELIFKPTGQRIIFRGADRPKKIKSTKFRNGYCKFIWYEEVDEFLGMDEIRMINQSLMRGGDSFCVFYSYNPPKSQRNWVNNQVLNPHDNWCIHHSNYLSVPINWLGAQFFIDAEHLKEHNLDAYRHEYLGEVTGTGGEVFKNITIREITDEEKRTFDRLARGLDWGYAVDPLHYTVNHFDKTRRKLYIFYELQKVGISNRVAAQIIKKENLNNGLIICDSAEPKSISEFRGYGLRVEGAKKGPDSVEYGIKWLQDLEEIIIDKSKCPCTAKEFLGYELESDSNGGFKANFPDKNNHSIDATRYSRESDMRNVMVR